MYISERFVFIELHKTGCTHIRNILKELFDGDFTGKHDQASFDLFSGERVFLGSIRDPWEWYTSLWAYGCDNKGEVFNNVTRRGMSIRGLGWRSNPYAAFLKLLANSRNPPKWMDTYKNVNDAEAFRAWLYMMHDASYLGDIGEGYGECSVSRIAGLLTFRYLKLFCTKLGGLNNLDHLSTFEELKKYENENCFIAHFIRNENLESDLLRGLEDFGAKIPSNKKSDILSRLKTNVSSRKHGPKYYYDSKSENLIAEREKLIIEKFGYVAPSLRAMALTGMPRSISASANFT